MVGRGHDNPLFLNGELSWLAFSRRVLALAECTETPLLERVKFAGIVGMLHEEFFTKRISGLQREKETLDACRAELVEQSETVTGLVDRVLRPALSDAGIPILTYGELSEFQQKQMRRYFKTSVEPILTPLAVDPKHPFPFISHLGLNIGLWIGDEEPSRFVRIKVPSNLPRWVVLPNSTSFVPLEQVIVANLDLLFPELPRHEAHLFRITRDSNGRTPQAPEELGPGSIVRQVGSELKARRFAGAVRLQIDASIRKSRRKWLARQIGLKAPDVYPVNGLLGLSDLARFRVAGHADLRYPEHRPCTHPRLASLGTESSAIFDEIARGDLLVHHPYHDFETSVGRFIQAAADDPAVLAFKLTIYRTGSDSPIIRALADAARRGKQVAVLVEITARYDEAPNIAWGRYLENEGVHVSYGVDRLKTHVKLCLVVREEGGTLRRYAHIGTGNYHPGNARVYEDLGLFTSNPEVCEDVSRVFNSLTAATPHTDYKHLLVAPVNMRDRFIEWIRREAINASKGRPAGIHAKLNQLQDSQIIQELYAASKAGVPIELIVRGLCCLRPGVAGLSETIRVSSVVGRFLEHSRIYRFENDGSPLVLLGSADWMKRNLSNRVETVLPVLDAGLREELNNLFEVYRQDNASAWDADADGVYRRRQALPGTARVAAQEVFIHRAERKPDPRLTTTRAS